MRCKDADIDPQPPTPQAEISIEINGLDTKSIDLTLSVRSAEMKNLDSWNFEKKPYRLKFDKKQSPLGAPVVPYMGQTRTEKPNSAPYATTSTPV